MRFLRASTLGAMLSLALAAAAARAAPAAPADDDSLGALLARIDSFMQGREVDGVTRDPRQLQNEPEEVRLSVVPQLLAFIELRRAAAWTGYEDDIVARADFLVAHQPQITTGTAFDGMLGHALLLAWEATGRAEYRDAAVPIVQRCLQLAGQQMTLNWGLMGAMALASWSRLTGDPLAAQKVGDVLQSLAAWQNADGSFPHYCARTKDMHYTSWMSQELMIVRSELPHPAIEVLLAGTLPFLETHVSPGGEPFYQSGCDSLGNCVDRFYSLGGGCANDYDTRGWINELGYLVLVLDGRDAGVQHRVMEFLKSLEHGGAWADKWAYRPPPNDPIYPWASGDPSVIRTSVIFWSLARLLHARGDLPVSVLPDTVPPPAPPPPAPCDGAATAARASARAPALAAALGLPKPGSPFLDGRRLASAGLPECEPAAAAPVALAITAMVARPGGGVEVRFVTPRGGAVRLAVHDVAGRVIGTADGVAEAGEGAIRWDGHDRSGRAAPAGVYFARLRCEGAVAIRSCIVLK